MGSNSASPDGNYSNVACHVMGAHMYERSNGTTRRDCSIIPFK